MRAIRSANGMLKGRLSVVVVVVIGLLLVLNTAAAAEDVNELFKQFNKVERKAKRNMFSGKNDKAIAGLQQMRALLVQIKTKDPDNPKAKTADSKYKKLLKDLERKTGKDLGGGSLTAGQSSETKLPPKPEVQPVTKTEPEATSDQTETRSAGAAATTDSQAAAGGDKLPGGVTSRIKKIDRSLKKVEQSLDRHSVQRAEFEIKQVDKTLAEIQDRYGDRAPADHPQMKALSQRIATVKARLKQAVEQADAEQAAADQAQAQNTAINDEWIQKLRPFTDRDSEQYLETRIWSLEDDQAAENRKNYETALALMDAYEQVDFPQGKSMDMLNTERSLKSTLKHLKEAYAKAETEQASAGWLDKLRPYVKAPSDKLLIASYTSDIDQIKRQKAIYEEAAKVFQQYRQDEFPQGKSFQLEQVEEDLAARLAEFPETYQRSVDDQVAAAATKLDQEIAYLNSKQDWKNDAKAKPYFLAKDRIDDAGRRVDRVAQLLPSGDPQLAALEDKMQALTELNQRLIAIRAERTRMIADRYQAGNAETIKTKAADLVSQKIPGIVILRKTIISEDWKEETVEEWTDTTKTAVRIRTTRSVTAQVAGKKPSGEVRLFTVYVAKDRRSDGSWGSLYGNLHSDLGDLMLEENVHKSE